MPRKLRAAKQRYDAKAELQAFAMVFECGHDYFSETGLLEPVRVSMEDRPAVEKVWRAAVRDAWKRVGWRFMETWQPDSHRREPWALEQFGEPPCQ